MREEKGRAKSFDFFLEGGGGVGFAGAKGYYSININLGGNKAGAWEAGFDLIKKKKKNWQVNFPLPHRPTRAPKQMMRTVVKISLENKVYGESWPLN